LAALGTLSACSNPVADHAKTATPQSSQGQAGKSGSKPASPSKSGGSTSAPTPTDPPTPVTLSCDQLITAAQLTTAAPGYSPSADYKPKSGSLQSQIVKEQKGVACEWANSSNSDTIEVGVARPAASSYTLLLGDAAGSSNTVPTYGTPPAVDGAFFTTIGKVGEVQVFAKGYWLVLDSTSFAEPGDPAPLIANLPAS
jgi:hypothetical protein